MKRTHFMTRVRGKKGYENLFPDTFLQTLLPFNRKYYYFKYTNTKTAKKYFSYNFLGNSTFFYKNKTKIRNI